MLFGQILSNAAMPHSQVQSKGRIQKPRGRDRVDIGGWTTWNELHIRPVLAAKMQGMFHLRSACPFLPFMWHGQTELCFVGDVVNWLSH